MNKPRVGPMYPSNFEQAEAEMTLRDRFACKALKLAAEFSTFPDLIAGRAYAIADAMLAEREKS